MQLTLIDSLPFTAVTISYHEKSIEIPNILVDTGSATTILAMDALQAIGIGPSLDDTLYTIRGVGGTEVVFTRLVDFVQIENRKLTNFEIEVGGMDYGFEINGILGMDFLTQSGAMINLKELNITFEL